MAASLNKVMLIGNLGADPVIRQTQDGKRLAQLSLATSESVSYTHLTLPTTPYV